MKRTLGLCVLVVFVLAAAAVGQVDKIVIAAGTPEDQALEAITKETDGQKKIAMYQDFLQKFASNPAAVTYGNWQLAQEYQTAGDLQKAFEYGDKAVTASPHNFDILVSQATIAQKLNDDAKMLDYSEKAGQAYQGIGKGPKPEGVSDQDFESQVAADKEAVKSSYDFLEGVGFTAITDEKDPRKRMSYIERFTTAYPSSKYQEQVSQYAIYTLGPGQLNDTPRLIAFGEKTLAANPNSVPTLLQLANTYADESKPASIAKAVTYSQKVIAITKADEPDADKARKLPAGVAHSTLGYAYMKQEKTVASVSEFKTAAALLKGQDDVSYATALYRLGYAYAKLKRNTEARDVLMEAVKIPGPLQAPSQDLLLKVNAARAQGK
jgi:tetratricopeptide (TPR) repeat protein